MSWLTYYNFSVVLVGVFVWGFNAGMIVARGLYTGRWSIKP